MILDHYTVYPQANSVEAFVVFDSTDPFNPSATTTARIVLDQAADLNSNPAFTDQDVANAIVAKTASPQVTAIAVPTPTPVQTPVLTEPPSPVPQSTT